MRKGASNPRRWKTALLLAVVVCSWIVVALTSGVQRVSADPYPEPPDLDSDPIEITREVGLSPSAVGRRRAPVDEGARAVPARPRPSTTDDPPPRDPTLATLELRILSSDERWTAVVLGDEPVFQIDASPTWTARGEVGVQTSTDRDESGEGRAWFKGGENNVYRFTNVQPGVPFAVAAADDFKLRVAEIEVAPFQPSESRVVEVAVDSDLRSLRGRVLAPDGAPVPRANVSVAEFGAESRIGMETDEEGRFVLPNIAAEELSLFIGAQGYAPLAEPRFRTPDGPLEIILERGRTVRVEVSSPDYDPVAEATVIGRLAGMKVGYSAYGRTAADGRCRLEHVPSMNLPLEVIVSGRTFRSVLPSDALEHRVELPAWQPLRVRVTGRSQAEGRVSDRVRLTPVDPEGSRSELGFFPLAGDEVVFERIFPGDYEAAFERYNGSTRLESSSPVRVEVRAGESAEASIVL